MAKQLQEFVRSFQKLERYCRNNGWKGWDPYDGLNSRLFKSFPIIRNNVSARLAWIQFLKTSRVNLRRLLKIPKGYNSKGLALFLIGYCNAIKVQELRRLRVLGDENVIKKTIIQLADLLLEVRTPGFSGSCWGYNFDWQSRAFFLPNRTPTVVATSFVVEALLEAHEVTGRREYAEAAISAGEFIRNDLHRIVRQRGLMFSYSPLDYRAVYNASLLGTKTLSLVYRCTQDCVYRDLAYQSALAVCDTQNEDGSFPHSDQVGNSWRDSFHTAFKLESLCYYQKYCQDATFSENLTKGFAYWLNEFFDRRTGVALYYEKNHRMIDLHCAAQAMPTLYNSSRFSSEKELATSVMEWAISNMQDEDGYFYFRKIGRRINRIPYMRWPNAWMFYGMSYYLLGCYGNENN